MARKKTNTSASEANLESYGRLAFFKGNEWISGCKDMYNGGRWKMYDITGERIGIFTKELKRIWS